MHNCWHTSYVENMITDNAASERKQDTVELEWPKHLWNHENMFETELVRAYEC